MGAYSSSRNVTFLKKNAGSVAGTKKNRMPPGGASVSPLGMHRNRSNASNIHTHRYLQKNFIGERTFFAFMLYQSEYFL
jgi:hypothetical protein